MSLPQPKELIKRVAELQDSLVETATKPFRDLAASLNLPVVEPPRLAELVESLPELPQPPTPEFLLPRAKATPTTEVVKAEVSKIRVEEERVEKPFKLKVV